MDRDVKTRLARNTALLYFRMFIMMGVTLFTTRVVLKVLGIDDYGIYNTIGGLVVLFSFMNNAMVTTTQRFVSYYLGKNDEIAVSRVFSVSLIVHFCIGIIIVLLSEVVGLWFLYYKMSLPLDRFTAAFWTLHLSIAITFVNILKSPYNACIISFEKMDFYAYISILEAFLKLGVVYILMMVNFDSLILYSILLLCVTMLIAFFYKLYCNIKFPISIFVFHRDRNSYVEIFKFSSYSLLGNAANIGAQHGTNLIVNSFTSVAVNAAIGVSNQLSQGIFSFVSNFQMAFNPIIVKLYAREEIKDLKNLLWQTSKFSFYMMVVVCAPLIIYCNEYIALWIENVPQYTIDFCRLTILSLLIDTIAEPLWKTVQASGNIKTYQIITSIIILANLPLSWFILYLNLSPVYVFGIKLIITSCAYFYRVYFVKKLLNFAIKEYLCKVLIPILGVSIAIVPICFTLHLMVNNYLFASILIILISSFAIFLIGMRMEERKLIWRYINNKLTRRVQ